MTHYDDGEEI